MIIPLGNKVLIQPIDESEKTSEGGLILVEKNTQLKKAKVLFVSEDIDDPRFLSGDIILFEGSGLEVEDGLLIRYDQAVVLLGE